MIRVIGEPISAGALRKPRSSVPSQAQIEKAAAAAAEKANGGKFADPLFYKPEHRHFWQDVIRTAFDAAEGKSSSGQSPSQRASKQEVKDFSDHCVYIRSVYLFMLRIWRDSNEDERKMMEGVAPLFFQDMTQVLSEYMIIAACRVTDPARERRNENFTVEMFTNSFSSDPKTFNQLKQLQKRMEKLREKILPARNKFAAHADREAVRSGKPLGEASWEQWEDFWSALREFVNVINEKTTGSPFEIDAAGVRGDAEMFLKTFRQGKHN